MREWLLIIETWNGTKYIREIRPFCAKTGDDCYRAIRVESKQCVAGY